MSVHQALLVFHMSEWTACQQPYFNIYWFPTFRNPHFLATMLTTANFTKFKRHLSGVSPNPITKFTAAEIHAGLRKLAKSNIITDYCCAFIDLQLSHLSTKWQNSTTIAAALQIGVCIRLTWPPAGIALVFSCHVSYHHESIHTVPYLSPC